jgi:hypothetical protein
MKNDKVRFLNDGKQFGADDTYMIYLTTQKLKKVF